MICANCSSETACHDKDECQWVPDRSRCIARPSAWLNRSMRTMHDLRDADRVIGPVVAALADVLSAVLPDQQHADVVAALRPVVNVAWMEQCVRKHIVLAGGTDDWVGIAAGVLDDVQHRVCPMCLEGAGERVDAVKRMQCCQGLMHFRCFDAALAAGQTRCLTCLAAPLAPETAETAPETAETERDMRLRRYEAQRVAFVAGEPVANLAGALFQMSEENRDLFFTYLIGAVVTALLGHGMNRLHRADADRYTIMRLSQVMNAYTLQPLLKLLTVMHTVCILTILTADKPFTRDGEELLQSVRHACFRYLMKIKNPRRRV